MQQKQCVKCGEVKDIDQFYKLRNNPSKRLSRCKKCKREQSALSYQKRSDAVKANRDARRLTNKEWLVNYLSDKRCVDCGYRKSIVPLQFDHVGDDKEYEIDYMVAYGFSIESIENEIAKCEIVCANCHAIRTANQFGSYRL